MSRWSLATFPLVFRRHRLLVVTAALAILFMAIVYFHLEKQKQEEPTGVTVGQSRLRGHVVTPSSLAAIGQKRVKYHFQPIAVFGGATLRLSVLDSFITVGEKCRNCLPNYFIKAHPGLQSKYRRGTAVLVHHQKSGGTTLRKCLKDLLGSPDRIGGHRGGHMSGASLLGSVHTDNRLLWMHILSERKRLSYRYIEGPNVMGMCEDIDANKQPCSYYMMLRDPIDRAISTYFYCKLEPEDQLCASHQVDARKVDIKQWVLHQRSFLFAQLTFDIRYCNMSRLEQQRLPCWYRQRMMMEETDVSALLEFVLDDLADRFAVIGMLDQFGQSLAMFEEVSVCYPSENIS